VPGGVEARVARRCFLNQALDFGVGVSVACADHRSCAGDAVESMFGRDRVSDSDCEATKQPKVAEDSRHGTKVQGFVGARDSGVGHRI